MSFHLSTCFHIFLHFHTFSFLIAHFSWIFLDATDLLHLNGIQMLFAKHVPKLNILRTLRKQWQCSVLLTPQLTFAHALSLLRTGTLDLLALDLSQGLQLLRWSGLCCIELSFGTEQSFQILREIPIGSHRFALHFVRQWASSSRALLPREPGVALTSSIASTWRCSR